MSADGSFTVGPIPWVLLWTISWFAVVGGAVVCGVKGRWIWLVVGLFTIGLGWLYGVTPPAEPGSTWERHGRRRAARHQD